MIKIAVCDDNLQDRNAVIKCCRRYMEEKGTEYQIAEYTSGEELLSGIDADILLLDVEMDGIDGVQVKNMLQRRKSDVAILFLSSHTETIPQAFGRQVYGFLGKPVDYELFREKMDFMLEDILEQERFVCCKNADGAQKILVNQIVYIQAYGKYAKIFLTGQEKYVFSEQSIGAWKEELEAYGFASCHRSYLVNCYYVEKIDDEVQLCGKHSLPVSRRMEKAFREAYKEYLWRKAK